MSHRSRVSVAAIVAAMADAATVALVLTVPTDACISSQRWRVSSRL